MLINYVKYTIQACLHIINQRFYVFAVIKYILMLLTLNFKLAL